VLWHCWLGEGHPVCKKLDVDLLMVTIWLELCTFYSSSSVVTPASIILAPVKLANPCLPGKISVKTERRRRRLCFVGVCLFISTIMQKPHTRFHKIPWKSGNLHPQHAQRDTVLTVPSVCPSSPLLIMSKECA